MSPKRNSATQCPTSGRDVHQNRVQRLARDDGRLYAGAQATASSGLPPCAVPARCDWPPIPIRRGCGSSAHEQILSRSLALSPRRSRPGPTRRVSFEERQDQLFEFDARDFDVEVSGRLPARSSTLRAHGRTAARQRDLGLLGGARQARQGFVLAGGPVRFRPWKRSAR